VDFSDPYFSDYLCLVVAPGSSITSTDDLVSGDTIAVRAVRPRRRGLWTTSLREASSCVPT